MNYHWNWSVFWENSPDGSTYFNTLLNGLVCTMVTAMSAGVIALLLGTFIGMMQTLPYSKIVKSANAYVELFRNIPLLVQMFLWYFVVPELFPVDVGHWIKTIPYASFCTVVISLGFFTSARIAVLISSSIQALPKGQTFAGMALGFTTMQTYRYVLLPMTFRRIIPALTNECLNLVKNSATGLAIGLMELTASGRSMQEFTLQTFESFIVVTLMYACLNIIVIMMMKKIERRVAIPGFTYAN